MFVLGIIGAMMSSSLPTPETTERLANEADVHFARQLLGASDSGGEKKATNALSQMQCWLPSLLEMIISFKSMKP